MKNHEVLAAFISANPGCTRSTIFSDAGLQKSLRTPAQIQAIAGGDKEETKRWNGTLNRFIRKLRRDGVDIRVDGRGAEATYTIIGEAGEDEEFVTPTPQAMPVEIIQEAPPVTRAEEPTVASLGFEELLAQLDEDAATVTSDDQVAFKEAQEIIK